MASAAMRGPAIRATNLPHPISTTRVNSLLGLYTILDGPMSLSARLLLTSPFCSIRTRFFITACWLTPSSFDRRRG